MARNPFEDFPAVVEELGLKLNHVVHVGAHKGQEMPYFKAAGITKFTLVEPQPDLVQELKANFPEATVVAAGCGAKGGMATLSVNKISSSSTLAAAHPLDKIVSTRKVWVTTLKHIALSADCAVVDAQGLELDVLKGADLSRYKLVVVETCTVRDPTMSSYYEDVLKYMEENGFEAYAQWPRDYQYIAKYVRGSKGARLGTSGDKIFDVVFVRGDA